MTSFTIDQLILSTAEQAILREFVTSWDQHKHPVLFVGAGLSRCARRRLDIGGDSKFSSWTELLDDIRWRLAKDDKELRDRLATDPLRLSQIFQEQFGRAALLDLIARHVPSSDFIPGEEHHLLRAIPWAAIVTTNYDDLLERTFEAKRKVRKVVTDEDLTQHRTLEDLLIVKMHGDLAMRDTIVLSEEDYRRYPAQRPGLSIKVRQLLIEHPLLFLGFSLTDPHFSTIDGWIRDTVGRVRLPAIAIMYGEPVPAERAMWKTRGIELVRLPPDDSLARLLTALAAERKLPLGRNPDGFNKRVSDLEQQAFTWAREDDPSRAKRLAECLRKIVAGAKSDLDEGAAAATSVRFFCWGWHNVLSHDGRYRDPQVSAPQTKIKAKEVYEQLSEAERRQLLMFALETETSSLRFDGAPVDIAGELTLNPVYRLMTDERASVYLYSARIQRNIGATALARKAIAEARALDPSTGIKTLLSAEIREILFQEGDAKEIEAELRRPLDEGSDVLAMCRRGADSLLLRQREIASQYYKVALERATTGDEKYAALWGQLACAHEVMSFGDEARSREAELWDRLRAIPEEERSMSLRALELIEDAGDTLLGGEHIESAIEDLLEFLDEARRLGWPHSPDHNVSYRIESAARHAARLLLGDDKVKTDSTEQIKQGLALLRRYGLAGETRKLFTHEHRDRLARTEADVAWFRDFSTTRPTLPRSADARLTAALCGIPLLTDSSIDEVVKELIERTDLWISDKNSGREDSLISDWWQAIMEMHEHLPENSAKQVLDAVTRYFLYPHVMFRVQPHRLTFGLWMRQGLLVKGGTETSSLARATVDAFQHAFKAGDSFWIRELAGCLGSAASNDLFSSSDVDLLGHALEAVLNTELDKPAFDDYRVLQLVFLIGEIDNSENHLRLAKFTNHANAIVRQNLRSSSLDLSFHCSRLVLGQMTPEQQQQLLHTAAIAGECILADKNEWGGVASLTTTLASLAAVLPSSRPVVLPLLTRLAQRDARALEALGCFPDLSAEEATDMVRLVEAALFNATGERSTTVWSIARWLGTGAARSTADEILEVLLGVCVSDSPDTRVAAIVAVSTYFRAHREASPTLRERCFRVVAQLAGHDPYGRVRTRAMIVLPIFARTEPERQAIFNLVEASARSSVAIERRVAECVRRELAP